MPINVNDPEFLKAEKEYHESSNLQEKLNALKKMISYAPKHKGGENLRQQLTTRRKKLEQEIIKKKKSGKSSFKGIKKEDMQAVILGEVNSGKSSLLSILTNADPIISEIQFTTTKPFVAIMKHKDSNIQIIEIPAISSNYYDKGVVNTSDTILILIENIEQIENILKKIENAKGKKIVVMNKIDKRNETEKRKIYSTLQSKRYNFQIISCKTKEGIEELKDKIFFSFDKIRVYTKEPGKEKSKNPIILSPNSTVKDVAEKILKGFHKKVKETKIWGPSSKFPGQKVGLNFKLKDLDIVEFKTR